MSAWPSPPPPPPRARVRRLSLKTTKSTPAAAAAAKCQAAECPLTLFTQCRSLSGGYKPSPTARSTSTPAQGAPPSPTFNPRLSTPASASASASASARASHTRRVRESFSKLFLQVFRVDRLVGLSRREKPPRSEERQVKTRADRRKARDASARVCGFCFVRTHGAAMSLNRSQCGGCSTEYNTRAAI